MAEQPLKILIVDDERNMQVTLDDILTELGYETVCAGSGPQAIKLVGSNTFDVALLDFKMPIMNGVEVFREIIKIAPDLKVILITAFYEQETIEKAIDEGIAGICHKPLNIPQLLACIQSHLQAL